MRTLPTGAFRIALAFVAIGALTACIDEKIVYEDKDAFEEPPSAAGSFLGYSDRDAKLTICGSCHTEKQGEWVETAHAGAWATLQDSGHAEAFCGACHSVNGNGNSINVDAGYVSTGDERYEDVQCEACHGPGLAHASNPSAENAPLATVLVGQGLGTGCAECHEGSHHPFVEEWAQSRHGSVNALAAGAEGTCAVCHTGEGALQAWGIDSRYIEQAQLFEPGQHMAITCSVCHDPHGGPNYAQLRFPIDVPNEEAHLCMKCHNRRGAPDPRSIFGPHAPEGPTLLGNAGWWPPQLEWQGTLAGTHGSPESNPKLCARCHVFPFEVTDATTGAFAFQSTGHLFTSTPCLDSDGKPTVDGNCSDSERSFAACAGSGCHANAGLARLASTLAVDRIAELTATLGLLVEQIPSSEFNSADSRYTAGEGSKFNFELASATGAAIHNPFLIEALLLASITEVERVYGLTTSSSVSLSPAFQLN